MITSAYVETLCLILKFVFSNGFELQRPWGRVEAVFPFILYTEAGEDRRYLHSFMRHYEKTPNISLCTIKSILAISS